MRLSGRRKDIYGLILASYARPADKADNEKAFLDRIRKLAKTLGFTYNDLPNIPWLQAIYETQEVEVLKRRFVVSLRAGLWRARKGTGPTARP